MPIYEYRCESCGFEKENLQRVSDPLLEICPRCGKNALKKLISLVGFQLKGTGWYKTDFKGSGSGPAKETTDAGEPAKAGSDGDKSQAESKTDKPASESKQDKPAGEAKADKPAGEAKTEPRTGAPPSSSGGTPGS